MRPIQSTNASKKIKTHASLDDLTDMRDELQTLTSILVHATDKKKRQLVAQMEVDIIATRAKEKQLMRQNEVEQKRTRRRQAIVAKEITAVKDLEHALQMVDAARVDAIKVAKHLQFLDDRKSSSKSSKTSTFSWRTTQNNTTTRNPSLRKPRTQPQNLIKITWNSKSPDGRSVCSRSSKGSQMKQLGIRLFRCKKNIHPHELSKEDTIFCTDTMALSMPIPMHKKQVTEVRDDDSNDIRAMPIRKDSFTNEVSDIRSALAQIQKELNYSTLPKEDIEEVIPLWLDCCGPCFTNCSLSSCSTSTEL